MASRLQNDRHSHCALILAPLGRDAILARTVLERARIECTICPELGDLVTALRTGAGVAVVAEEALLRADPDPLHAWVQSQSAWSDLPFIVLTSAEDLAARNRQSAQLTDMLQNVTLLERPLQSMTLISAVRSGLRARRRQYEVRDYLADIERAAGELKALNDTLEERVHDRTRRLENANHRLLAEIEERRRTEDALRQAQKMQAVGQLTGGVAHDFNNVLTVIGANLEILHDRLTDSPKLHRLVAAASRAVDRAAKLTQQLLAFSRKQRLEPRPINLNAIIEGVDDLLRRTVGESIELTKSLPDELWPALADPNQVETVLLNLVINARDAIEGSGRIAISTRNFVADEDYASTATDAAPGEYVEFCVADTGSGMPEEVKARAFEPFFTTKEVGKGSGLGLSMVYGFVRQSNGHVRLDSEEGHGTTVRIYLPRALQQAEQPEPREPGLPAGAAPRGDDTGIASRILVVEDNDQVREIAVSVLQDNGYTVYEAPDATRALEVLARHPDIDLVFTDLIMPGELNGIDFAKIVSERWPGLRLLVTSGYAERLVSVDRLPTETPFLTKPYRPLDLITKIRSSLDGVPDGARVH
jgi:signal transduction histidine kinase